MRHPHHGHLGQHPMHEEKKWQAAIIYTALLVFTALASSAVTAFFCFQLWAK